MTVKIDSERVTVVDVHVHPWVSLEDLVSAMDKAGVDKAVLLLIDIDEVETFRRILEEEKRVLGTTHRSYELARSWYGVNVVVTDEEAKSYIEKHRERFVVFGSVNPHRGEGYVREGIKKIKSHGFKGVKLLPTLQFFNPKDDVMRPVYKYSSREGLVILMHTGCDPGPWESPEISRNANPKYLDGVAEEYPNLKIIAAHMGSYSLYDPGIWFEEMMKVAIDHDNIYVDTAAIRDIRLIERAVKTMGADRVLYGSDYPVVVNFSDEKVGMWKPLHMILDSRLRSEAKKRILGENAIELLQI